MPGREGPEGLASALRRLAAVSALLLAAASVAGTPVMYRYINDNGQPVYSYTLPPAQAKAGYQKIDPHTGRVLETVAAQLSPAELAEKLRREQALQACQEELDRIYQLYGSERDVQHALQENLASLDTRISQLKTNLRQATQEQRYLRSQAADAERTGREIPRTLLDNMERSRSQIASLEAEIEQRRREQAEAEGRYARDLARFRDGTCPDTLADAQSGAH